MNINKELCVALKIEWHEEVEIQFGFIVCSCGHISFNQHDFNVHRTMYNPDFVSDPRLVLRSLEHGVYAFIDYLMEVEEYTHYDVIDMIYGDITGELAKLALEWLKEEK